MACPHRLSWKGLESPHSSLYSELFLLEEDSTPWHSSWNEHKVDRCFLGLVNAYLFIHFPNQILVPKGNYLKSEAQITL